MYAMMSQVCAVSEAWFFLIYEQMLGQLSLSSDKSDETAWVEEFNVSSDAIPENPGVDMPLRIGLRPRTPRWVLGAIEPEFECLPLALREDLPEMGILSKRFDNNWRFFWWREDAAPGMRSTCACHKWKKKI
ncbi:hypothetical protein Tco_1070301 [Tanacetum coccineum]|uniref:Uncharacterized protein n=1 Tax=Tanacetum coccineum TaxID=301880 RepID=A0ABQ5HLB2_9ASTR